MIHRGKIIKIAMPDILIDTDGEFNFHLNENWVEIMKEQVIAEYKFRYRNFKVVEA